MRYFTRVIRQLKNAIQSTPNQGLSQGMRFALGSMICAALMGPAKAQYQLVWQDNFDGTDLDLSRWEPLIGNGCPSLCGWGNNELQYYRSENATVGGGTLKITAKQEFFGGMQYTSARLRTKNKGDWTYGRYEMRAKLPTGKGIWPAFWLFPTDEVYGTWAASGELDVMELIGQEPNKVYGTLHFGAPSPGNTQSGGNYTLPSGSFHDDFHVFAVEWDANEIRWYVDGILYSTKTSWWSSGGPYPAPFNERFHLILNCAVGGNWPGSPDASTSFPQTFEIDYVRVYQEGDPDDCVQVFDDMEHGDPLGSGYFTFDGPGAGGGISIDPFDLPPIPGNTAALQASWSSGGTPGYLGGFGRSFPLSLGANTNFEFWINPPSGLDGRLEINLQDDDNGDGVIPSSPDGQDDEFQYSLEVSPTGPGAISGGGWQLISIPLDSFVDDGSYHFGGNGVLDPVATSSGGNGPLVNVVFALFSNTGAPVTFKTDHWAFTRGETALSGKVWSDENEDGSPSGEPGLGGVRVDLWDTVQGSLADSTTTPASGDYAFSGLPAGAYEIRIDPATLPGGVTATFDPDGTGTLHSSMASLLCGDDLGGQSFGYAPANLGETLCAPAVPNSTGSSGVIIATGSVIAANNEVILTGASLPTNQFGYFLNSMTQGLVFGPGGSQGNLCLSGQLGRYSGPNEVVNSGGLGFVSLTLDLPQTPTPLGLVSIQPGQTWIFQLWYRDANPGPTSNFTDAVQVLFQ